MKATDKETTPLSPFQMAVQKAQKDTIQYALETADNDWNIACSRLGLTQQHFRYYCDRLGIETPSSRSLVAPSISNELSSDAIVEFEDDQDSNDQREQEPEAKIERHVTYNAEGEREIPMELLLPATPTGNQPPQRLSSNVIALPSGATRQTLTSPTLIMTTTVQPIKRGRGRPRKIVDIGLTDVGSTDVGSDDKSNDSPAESENDESASDEI